MSKVFLYNAENPKGQIFDADYVERHEAELEEAGWVDTPEGLVTEEPVENRINLDDLKESTPEDLVSKVKEMGYHVLNDIELEQMKAELAGPDTAGLSHIPDEELLLEIEERGLFKVEGNQGADVLNDLFDRFQEKPTDLNKEELIMLGKGYDLKLNMNMKEETMINHINGAINGGDE